MLIKSFESLGKKTLTGLLGVVSCMAIFCIPLSLRISADTSVATAVFFPPWYDRDMSLRRVMAADGVPLRSGRLTWIIIAKSDEKDFSQRLYKSGAWLVGGGLNDLACAAGGIGEAS